MPDNTVLTRYRTLTASWKRWVLIQHDAVTIGLYNRADAHITALSDALFDIECEYPTIVGLL